jgi:hypothetical protein
MTLPRAIGGSFLLALTVAAGSGPVAAAPRTPGPPCTVIGTPDDDRLDGTPGPDVICGFGGDDVMAPGLGRDQVRGGQGQDIVAYGDAQRQIRGHLGHRVATGAGRDTFTGVEGLIGSPQDDVLIGNAGPNELLGREGTDLLFGRASRDTLEGGRNEDYLAGEEGRDRLMGGRHADVCDAQPRSSCFPISPPDPNDAGGILDVGRVRTALGGNPRVWTIVTRNNWGLRKLWDDGFFLVYLDTAGGSGFEYRAMIRSNGRKLVGTLFRERNEEVIRSLKASRVGPRGARVRVPFGNLRIGSAREYFRWSVLTLYSSKGCRRTCFDAVPGTGALAHPL